MEAEYSPIKLSMNNSTNDFFIEHIKIASGTSMKTEHYHDYYEMYLYLGDGMKYFIGNKSFYVKKHDLILIDKFTYHRTSYNEKGHNERILVYINESVFDMLSGSEDDIDLKHKVVSLFQKKKVSFHDNFSKVLFEKLMYKALPHYYDSTNPLISSLQSKLIVVELLLEILKMDSNKELIEDDSVLTPQENRVSAIVNYIDSNYNKQISLDELSKEFFINKYYLCHIFKDITGMSITDFINRKRLAESKKLLKYSDYNITEISEMVGFNSSSRFISLFREKFDQTPKMFRVIYKGLS